MFKITRRRSKSLEGAELNKRNMLANLFNGQNDKNTENGQQDQVKTNYTTPKSSTSGEQSKTLKPVMPAISYSNQDVLNSMRHAIHQDLLAVMDQRDRERDMRQGQMMSLTQVENKIDMPDNILESEEINEDRLLKVQKTFSNIPMYDSNVECIRDYLQKLNARVNSLSAKMTSAELKAIIESKMPSKLRACLNPRLSLQETYALLQDISGRPMKEMDARSVIRQTVSNTKFENMQEFLLTITPLLNKIHDPHTQADILGQIGYDQLTPSLKSKYNEYFQNQIDLGRGLTVGDIRMFLTGNAEEIENNWRITSKKTSKYNNTQSGPSQNTSTKKKDGCGICGKKHPTELCWSNKVCENCGRKGHISKVCRANLQCAICFKHGHDANKCSIPCNLCGWRGHSAVNCKIYSHIEPVAESCPVCLLKGATLFHPVSLCRNSS